MRTLRLNIALLPDPQLARDLAALASRLGGTQPKFRIGPDFWPHLTLYMANLEGSATHALDRVVDSLVESPIVEVCRSIGIALTGNGYIEVSYEKTEALLRLQKLIIDGMERYRNGVDAEPEPHLSDAEFANLRNYGYEFVGDQFRPHITLGKFDPTAPVSLPALDRDRLRFTPAKLAVMVANGDGASRDVLRDFPLAVVDAKQERQNRNSCLMSDGRMSRRRPSSANI